MTPKYYCGSVARGHAADIRAAEVPTDYEVKARKADREFSGVEYVRNGPPGPVHTLLRSMPPTIGLVVGERWELSRSVKHFVSDCAKKGSISPKRFGCCHGQDQARVSIIANFINRAFGWVSLRGVARVWHAALTASTVSKQHAGMRGGGTRGTRLATGDWRSGSEWINLPA